MSLDDPNNKIGQPAIVIYGIDSGGIANTISIAVVPPSDRGKQPEAFPYILKPDAEGGFTIFRVASGGEHYAGYVRAREDNQTAEVTHARSGGSHPEEYAGIRPVFEPAVLGAAPTRAPGS